MRPAAPCAHLQGGYQSPRVINLLLQYITQASAVQVSESRFFHRLLSVQTSSAWGPCSDGPLGDVAGGCARRARSWDSQRGLRLWPHVALELTPGQPPLQALAYSHTWKALKPHVEQMLLQ